MSDEYVKEDTPENQKRNAETAKLFIPFVRPTTCPHCGGSRWIETKRNLVCRQCGGTQPKI